MQSTRQDHQPQAPSYEGDIDSEDEDYIGTKDERPPRPFTIEKDIRKGFFVFVRLGEGCNKPIWLGIVVDQPQMNASLPTARNSKFGCGYPTTPSQQVQMHIIGGIEILCSHINWILDRISTDSVVTSWKPGKGRIQCAPAMEARFAEDILRRISEFERNLM